MQFALEYKNKTKPTTLTKNNNNNNNNKNFPNPVESLKLWGNILTHCQEFKGKRTMQIENLIFFTV